MDLNKVMLIGRVVRDPETKTTPSGQSVSNLSVATNKVWKDAEGQKQEKAEFHNLVAWRRTSEIVAEYVKKGQKIYVEGELQTRSWDDPNGIKRYRTEVVINNLIILDKVDGQTKPQEIPKTTDNSEEISIEDIPF